MLEGEGERIGSRGHRVLAELPQLEALELSYGPDFEGVEPHVHPDHTDSFYVLEGEVEFHVGDEIVTATPGAYVLAPPDVVHSFRNVGTETARLLNLHTPGGFVEYRRELESLRAQGVEPDDAFFERHDVFDV